MKVNDVIVLMVRVLDEQGDLELIDIIIDENNLHLKVKNEIKHSDDSQK